MAEEELTIPTVGQQPDVKKFSLSLIVMAVAIVIDQITKQIAVRRLAGEPIQYYFNDFLILTYTENHGAFLSLGANWPPIVRQLMFTVAVIGFLLYFAYFLWQESHMPYTAYFFGGLVLGGGLGNLLDRLYNNGGVIDFLLLRVGNVQTGIFNVADMAVMAGVVGLIVFGSGAPPEPEPPITQAAEFSEGDTAQEREIISPIVEGDMVYPKPDDPPIESDG